MKLSIKDFQRKRNYWFDFPVAWFFHANGCVFYRVHYLFDDFSKIDVYQTNRGFAESSEKQIKSVIFDRYDDLSYQSDLRYFRDFLIQCNNQQLVHFLSFSYDNLNSTLFKQNWNQFLEFCSAAIGENKMREVLNYFNLI